MKRDFNNIEELFKENMDSIQELPSDKVLKTLRRKLIVRDFFSLNPRKPNIAYAAILVLGVLLIPFNTPQNEAKTISESAPQQNKLTSGDQKVEENSEEKSTVAVAGEIKNTPKEDKTERKFISAFTVSDEEGCAPFKVQFSNTTSEAVKYTWHFGGGEKSTAKNPTHTFNEAGVYNVTLIAENKSGAKSEYSQRITVHPQPVSDFEIDVKNSDLELKKVSFRNKSENATNFDWSFGDAQSSKTKNPQHSYNTYKAYDVKMVATSEFGCTDTTIVRNSFISENYSLVFPEQFRPAISGPNNGYYNQPENGVSIFYPKNSGAETYNLTVKSASGAEVFSTDNIFKGWDGYIRGRIAPQGKYYYHAKGVYPNGQEFEIEGDFYLINDATNQDFYNQ